MRSTRQFKITSPDDMAETVPAKVASGENATESEVIRHGSRVLISSAIRQSRLGGRTEVLAATARLEEDPFSIHPGIPGSSAARGDT